LANTKCEKATFTVDPACADTHGVPPDFVEHSANPVDLVCLDVNRPVKDDLNHGVAADFGREMSICQSSALSVKLKFEKHFVDHFNFLQCVLLKIDLQLIL
jgi:hypothetical protein